MKLSAVITKNGLKELFLNLINFFMNISQSNKIFSLENIFIFLPSVICIYAGYLIFNYPVDMVINDEIYLLLDIRQNNFILDWNIFTQDKAGTKCLYINYCSH